MSTSKKEKVKCEPFSLPFTIGELDSIITACVNDETNFTDRKGTVKPIPHIPLKEIKQMRDGLIYVGLSNKHTSGITLAEYMRKQQGSDYVLQDGDCDADLIDGDLFIHTYTRTRTLEKIE
jgi:hypothetical protein